MMAAKAVLARVLRKSGPLPEGHVDKRQIGRFIPTGPVVIDAGAHVGSDTLEMRRLWPKGRYYAFEPIPSLFTQLERNVRRRRNVRCYPLALSDMSGNQTMYVSSGASNASSSLLAPTGHLIDHPDTYFDVRITVTAMTIDDWALQEGVAEVDLLWLDMQGYELAALKASPRVLRTVKAIHAEVSIREQYAGAPLYPEVRAWLKGHGFRVEAEAIPSHWDGGNVLFVRAM